MDPSIEPLTVMFKDGDDLRQDILIMQLFSLMDQLWRAENLDLKMITFTCLSTGLKQGQLLYVNNNFGQDFTFE